MFHDITVALLKMRDIKKYFQHQNLNSSVYVINKHSK